LIDETAGLVDDVKGMDEQCAGGGSARSPVALAMAAVMMVVAAATTGAAECRAVRHDEGSRRKGSSYALSSAHRRGRRGSE
jgi:hypothetical protein